MPPLSVLSIPLLTAAAVLVPVLWAQPWGLAPWRSWGIATGWAGSGLLLASLLLMLRDPRLARALGGLERMYRWHHGSGVTAYVLLLMHPLLLAMDDWPARPELAWQLLSPMEQGWPVRTGWISLLLLMAGLAATFRTGMPYRRWRLLHAGMGVGVLCGLLHVALLGVPEAVWPAILLAVLFLGWRILGEDAGFAAHPYIVHTVLPVAADMVEIELRALARPVAATPGQFVLLALLTGPGFRGCGEYHPFTVSAVKDGTSFRIAVKALGDCTRRMQSVTPGSAARVQGAFGHFLGAAATAPQLWIAGGIGIAPFLARLRAGALGQPTRLLYLFRSEADAAFLPELEALARRDALLSLDAHATGLTLPDLDGLLPDAAHLAGHECHLCGPPGLVRTARRILGERGIRVCHIHFENFEFR